MRTITFVLCVCMCVCMTRQTDLTTRFTKESYLFLLVYNRAPNDSKWNPFLSFSESNTDSASCRFKRRALHGETNSLKKKEKEKKRMGRYRNIYTFRPVKSWNEAKNTRERWIDRLIKVDWSYYRHGEKLVSRSLNI